MKIKALSIVAPNGRRIASGHKVIEVRSWLPEIDSDEDLLIVENKKFLSHENDVDPHGVAVAIVKISKISAYQPQDIPAACATIWDNGYHSWHLKDVRPIIYNFSVEARKGIYEVDLKQDEIQFERKSIPLFNEEFYYQRFLDLLKRNKILQQILDRSETLDIPNWAVGAGFLQQSIFNLLHGKPILSDIKDIDWVYFDDSDLSDASEQLVAKKVQEVMKDIPIPFDVKNQGRVHLWYRNKFGYDINPYKSLEDAISTWPTISSAIALSQKNSKLKVIAPFGVSDLLNMIVRANKRQVTEEIYYKKADRLQSHWPRSKVFSWNES